MLVPTRDEDISTFGRFFSAYLNNQTQSVTLFHNRTVADTANAVELTVSGLSIGADLPGIEAELIHSVEVVTFGIGFDPRPSDNVYASGRLRVLFGLPSNVNVSLLAKKTTIEFTMGFPGRPVFGRMNLHELPVQHDQLTNELMIDFQRQLLTIVDRNAFVNFTQTFTSGGLDNRVSFGIAGLASITGLFAIGTLDVDGIALNNTISLDGLGGLKDVHVNGISINGEENGAFQLSINTTIVNPGSTFVQLQSFILQLADHQSGTMLGRILVDVLTLEPGKNTMILHGFASSRHCANS